jgi:hypothetical protein
MKYIISQHGTQLAVALLDEQTAEQDINLSHNILNINANHSFYNGVLNFPSIQSFYRYLINKYYLLYWNSGETSLQILRRASNKTRQVLKHEVKYRNFMTEIYVNNIVTANKSIYKWNSPKYSD